MPCTLQPWEIEFEERRLNKTRFQRELTDSLLLEEVACSACRTLEKEKKLAKAPFLVRKWWKLHKAKDAEKARRRK